MKNEDLYRAIGDIDEKFVREAREEKKQKKMAWIKWAATAACVGLAAVGVWSLQRWETKPVIPPTPDHPIVAPTLNPNTNLAEKEIATSDTYENLEGLLGYLSENEHHSSSDAKGIVNINSTGERVASGDISEHKVQEGESLALGAGYAYHIVNGEVKISDLSKTIASIREKADKIYLCGERLVLVSSFWSGGDELNPEISARIMIYDISNPATPVLRDEFTQLGSISACYLAGDKLILMTSDGVCACGWSRLDDVKDYVPKLEQNGETIDWTEEEVSILGAPSSVKYVAALQLDVKTGNVVDKQAFYGDISEIFYGYDWFVAATHTTTEKVLLHPDIYVFSTENHFTHTGRISMAALLNLSSGVSMTDGKRPEGMYPRVYSVTKKDGIYRILGEVSEVDTSGNSNRFLAVTADLQKGESNCKILELENAKQFSLDDLLWEQERAIATISIVEGRRNSSGMDAQFLFVAFDGMDIKFHENAMRVGAVRGIDMMYSYGSPFGELDTLIPMGNNLYLRYNGLPDGLDIFDFAESESPKQIYDSQGDILPECRFEFIWEVYDENTFGIMLVTPDEEGDFRNATFSWNIYEINVESEKPYTLRARFDFGKGESFLAVGIGFATAEYEGVYYCATMESDVIYKIEW